MIQAVLGDRYRLGERIADGGRLPWPEAFALGEQVARALDAAHALVHRDVKPGNVPELCRPPAGHSLPVVDSLRRRRRGWWRRSS
jgi:hypothetical protein